MEVQFFAGAKEAVGKERVTLNFDESITVGELKDRLGNQFPGLHRWNAALLFAVGTDYVDESRRLNDGDQIVCFPPVSGG